MREWWRHAVLVGPPAAAGVILGLLGPFGTFQALAWPARITYWLSIVLVNWVLCDLAVRRLDAWISDKAPARSLMVPLAGSLLAAIPATGVVHTAGSIAGLPGESIIGLFWKVFLVCAVLSVVFYLNASEAPDPAGGGVSPAPDETESGDSPTTGNLFFQRLGDPIAGELLCLQMQDHYLVVHTSGGQQLLLCRMEDAARELGALGQRVHRSWWVAHAAVERVNRSNGRLSILLTDGREVPVGRTYQRSISWQGNTGIPFGG